MGDTADREVGRVNDSSMEPIVRALPFAALILDASGSIRFANPELRHLVGPSAGDLKGKPFFGALPLRTAAKDVESRFREGVLRGGPPFFYVAELDLEAWDPPLKLKVHLSHLQQADGSPASLAVLEPLPSDEQLLREIESLERSIGTVNEIRHEINNLLMGLIGLTELLQDSPGLDDGARRKVEAIFAQSRLVQEQVKEMGGATRSRR